MQFLLDPGCFLILFRQTVMQLEHLGNQIQTDYYSSRDCEDGIPWCYIAQGTWHLLLPGPPRGGVPEIVEARPVTCMSERDGWRWRVEIGGWHLPLYWRCLRPYRPRLPEPWTRDERRAVLYCGHLERRAGSSFFGALEPGLQVCAEVPLWIVREKDRTHWLRQQAARRQKGKR
jgi:hypothetical protein